MSTATQDSVIQQNNASEGTETMQLVSFRLAEELYGIEITRIREIILIPEITRIPQAPHYVRGLINLRSTVIPVVDLRTRFELPEGDTTDESRIMVLHVGKKTVGIVVDGVDEVLRISQDQIDPPPPTVAGLEQEYLTGLVKLEDRLLILLDVDKVLAEQDLTDLEAAGAR